MIHYENNRWSWECVTCHDGGQAESNCDAWYLLGWHAGFRDHNSIKEPAK